jgi:hypothetical protein
VRKRFKRLAVVGGSLFILAMGFIVAEHARGRWSLRQHLSRLEQRGEVLAVPALEPARPLAEDNAALTLMAWSNRWDAILTNHLRSPHSLRFATPGRVIVTATQSQWNADGEIVDDWEEVRTDIERDADLPGDMGRAFEMERAMTMDFYRQIRRSRATLNRLVAEREATEWINLTGSLPTAGFWLHSLHVPVWRVAWIDQDALRSMKQWEIMIERERLVRSNSWSALPGRRLAGGGERGRNSGGHPRKS